MKVAIEEPKRLQKGGSDLALVGGGAEDDLKLELGREVTEEGA